MLIYVYLFALVLGGVLLVTSIVMGGDDADADVDTDMDMDADADMDMDMDADADADGDGELGQQGLDAHGDTHGSLAGVFGTLLSLRFWTFFSAFFGLTGLVLDGLDLVPGKVIPLAIAIGMGVVTGMVTVRVIRGLARSSTDQVANKTDYVGKSGRVLLAFGKGDVGKVRLEVKGTTVDVLARSEESKRFTTGQHALVLEMEGTTAHVAHIDTTS